MLIKKAKSDDSYQARIYAACQKDIMFWINNFCWTKDPRPDANPKVIPFIAYEFQEEFILNLKKHILEGKDVLVEKSRDMGATWCCLYVFQWFWLFQEGYDFLVGSQSQDDVDQSGNPKSLFPRLRLNLEKQPSWILPNNYQNSFLRIVNNDLQSTIVGEANTVNFSRQGRFSAIMFDEFAVWSESGRKNSDEQAWTAAGDASPCRIAVSSAKGRNNKFYRLRSQEEQQIDVIRLHWKLHPKKDKAWYAQEKARRSKSELAQEVDIDYAASVRRRAAENYNPAIHILRQDEWRYNPKAELQLQCDFNVDPMCWSVSESSRNEDITFKEYTIKTTVTENVIKQFCYDFQHHQNKIIYIYGDASGKARSTRSRHSDYEIIKRYLNLNGWKVYMYHNKFNPSHEDRIAAVNKRLRDWEFGNKAFEYITEDCPKLTESVEQTQTKDGGILKDGMEHHFDGWSYRIEKKYPVKRREATTYIRG